MVSNSKSEHVTEVSLSYKKKKNNGPIASSKPWGWLRGAMANNVGVLCL